MALLAARFPAASDPLGPAFLPLVVAAGLASLGLVTLARGGQAADPAPEASAAPRVDPAAAPRLVAAVTALAAFLAAVTWGEGLGFPVFAPLLLLVLGLIFGGRLSLGAIIGAVAVAEGTYGVFRYWFGLPLPGSAWF